MNRSTRGSRRSPLWKDIFKTGRARNKPNENQSSNKLALPQELEDIIKNKKVIYAYYYMAIIIINRIFKSFTRLITFDYFRTPKTSTKLLPLLQR